MTAGTFGKLCHSVRRGKKTGFICWWRSHLGSMKRNGCSVPFIKSKIGCERAPLDSIIPPLQQIILCSEPQRYGSQRPQGCLLALGVNDIPGLMSIESTQIKTGSPLPTEKCKWVSVNNEKKQHSILGIYNLCHVLFFMCLCSVCCCLCITVIGSYTVPSLKPGVLFLWGVFSPWYWLLNVLDYRGPKNIARITGMHKTIHDLESRPWDLNSFS